MLHLQTRICLDEEETIAVRGIYQEFEGSKTLVGQALSHTDSCVTDLLPSNRAQTRARSDLDKLLMPALDAALTLSEMSYRSAAVADDLDLYVASPRHELLDIDRAVAESRGCLGLAACVCLLDLFEIGDHAHPAPSATADCFDDHGSAVAKTPQELSRLARRDRPGTSCQDRHPLLPSQPPRARLVTEKLQCFNGGTDEGDAFLGAAAGELGAFGEKAVARMDRVAASRCCDRQEALDVEIRASALSYKRTGFVCAAHVERLGIVVREDGRARQSQLLAARAMRIATSPRLAISSFLRPI